MSQRRAQAGKTTVSVPVSSWISSTTTANHEAAGACLPRKALGPSGHLPYVMIGEWLPEHCIQTQIQFDQFYAS
jgi:hypothetical protein